MNTISGEDWKKAIARKQVNMVSAQITLRRERLLVVHYTKNEASGKSPYYSCFYIHPDSEKVANILLGVIEEGRDGFYYFHPAVSGVWSSGIMKDIAHKLEALNEAWVQKLDER